MLFCHPVSFLALSHELNKVFFFFQIFVPILVRALDGSGLHWYLLVVDIENGIRYILDSLPSRGTRSATETVVRLRR